MAERTRKKVTLRDVAERTKLSQNTVSLVLRGKEGISQDTRERVFSAARELGYTLPSPVSASMTLCVVSTADNSVDSYFYAHVLNCIETELRLHGHQTMLYSISAADLESQAMLTFFSSHQVRGIIVMGDLRNEYIDLLYSSDLPVLGIGFFPDQREMDCVLEDNFLGAMLAMRELQRCGYKRIGYIGDINATMSFLERYMGYQAFFVMNPQEKALPCDAWTMHSHDTLTNIDALEDLLRRSESLPEAFFCANDKVAVMTMKAAQRCSLRVPDDLGLIGFDRSELCELSTPTLSSIDTFYEQQSRRAVSEILRKIKQNECRSTVGRILTPVELWRGESVQSPTP